MYPMQPNKQRTIYVMLLHVPKSHCVYMFPRRKRKMPHLERLPRPSYVVPFLGNIIKTNLAKKP